MVKEKICKKCNISKQIQCFYNHKDYKDKVMSSCKDCCNKAFYKRQKELRAIRRKERENKRSLKHPYPKNSKEYRKSIQLSAVYGITLLQYNDMFNNQNGCCAICNKHQKDLKSSLVVDHNHITGQVRSLLCFHCNFVIGHAMESELVLTKAINYLDKWNK